MLMTDQPNAIDTKKVSGEMQTGEITDLVEQKDRTELGDIRIANEVVAVIAGLAAIDVKGVAGMSGGIAGGIAEMLGRKSLAKGVKVEVGDEKAAVDIYVVVEYGVRIPETAWRIQEGVKRAIETMTGLQVMEVDVHIQGVHIPTEDQTEEAAKVR